MKLSISTNFARYSDPAFLGYSRAILECMQNNPNFTDPVPPLTIISQLIDEFNVSLADAGTKNVNAIATKNVCRVKLEHQVGRLALYVMYVADENEEVLVSSGYRLSKKPRGAELEEPQQHKLTSGLSSGKITSTIKAVKGAKYYLFEITSGEITDDSVWETHSCSRRKYTFTNLTPGKKYQ